MGQIVFIGKTVTNEICESLLIPFGKSKEYNQGKFAKPKRTSHFTEDYSASRIPPKTWRVGAGS